MSSLFYGKHLALLFYGTPCIFCILKFYVKNKGTYVYMCPAVQSFHIFEKFYIPMQCAGKNLMDRLHKRGQFHTVLTPDQIMTTTTFVQLKRLKSGVAIV